MLGHDQAPLGGGRDAQVHVCLTTIYARLVPGRVDQWVQRTREQRLARTPAGDTRLSAKLRQIPDPLHRAAIVAFDVDLQELGDVRCGKALARTAAAVWLAHPPEAIRPHGAARRSPGGAGFRRLRARAHAAWTSSLVMRHPARSRTARQVDAEVRAAADRRLGQCDRGVGLDPTGRFRVRVVNPQTSSMNVISSGGA